MQRRWSRTAVCALALVVAGAATSARAEDPLAYLESLKGSNERYKAPSEIDPRYTIALYVNAATRGQNRQRMWLLQRDKIGGDWRLALWDKHHWRKQKLADGEVPPYSWPVSTGRYYRGDRFSGPTPTGVFALDERKWRYGRGWSAPGMVHAMYIDLHYSSGRRSGVAFHGTTRSRYRRLGRADSHGCIRMRQENALAVLNRVTGRDGDLPEEMRWGEVPRFWKSQRGQKRRGYTRDGTTHPVEPPELDSALADIGKRVQVADLSEPSHLPVPADGELSSSVDGDVLTKTGFRAIAVIFTD